MMPCEKFGLVRSEQMQSLIKAAAGIECGPLHGRCRVLGIEPAPEPVAHELAAPVAP